MWYILIVCTSLYSLVEMFDQIVQYHKSRDQMIVYCMLYRFARIITYLQYHWITTICVLIEKPRLALTKKVPEWHRRRQPYHWCGCRQRHKAFESWLWTPRRLFARANNVRKHHQEHHQMHKCLQHVTLGSLATLKRYQHGLRLKAGLTCAVASAFNVTGELRSSLVPWCWGSIWFLVACVCFTDFVSCLSLSLSFQCSFMQEWLCLAVYMMYRWASL